MKEYQRIHAVGEITTNINEKNSLQAKISQLEEMKKNPAVASYLALLEEIEKIREKYKVCNKKEKIIEEVFKKFICDDFKCHHEIWLYEGSYYLSIDYLSHEHDHWCREKSESLPVTKGKYEFKHNRYVCLECGEIIETKDWQAFERSHFVLKNQNENIDIEEYRRLYYLSLYDYSVKESRDIVIRNFEIEKAKGKTRTLHP